MVAQTTPSLRTITIPSPLGEPVWEIAEFFPHQGEWTERQYLALDTKRRVEFNNGMLEVLALPKKIHEIIVTILLYAVKAYIDAKHLGGLPLPSGYKLRIPTGKYRLPDLIYMSREQESRSNEDFTEEAQLVIEVVSADPQGIDRDYVAKRLDYAAARVSEYWIVDRESQSIVVLKLERGEFVQHGEFKPGQVLTSALFPDFTLAADDILNPKGLA